VFDKEYTIVFRWQSSVLSAKLEADPPPTKHILTLVHCLAHAVSNLHTVLKIKHNNVKPDNILIDANWNPILVDFGFAQGFSSVSTHSALGATDSFASPEQYHRLPLNRKSDVFSLGIVFYHILAFTIGLQNSNITKNIAQKLKQEQELQRQPQVIEGIRNAIHKQSKKEPSWFHGLLQDLLEIIIKMLQLRPEHRPSITEVCKCLEDLVPKYSALKIKLHCPITRFESEEEDLGDFATPSDIPEERDDAAVEDIQRLKDENQQLKEENRSLRAKLRDLGCGDV